jgi:hypothetical protein
VKRLLLCLLCVIGTASLVQAQTDQEKIAHVLAFDAQVHRIDLYNQILPILMTKQQLRQILPPIEKARDRVRKVRNAEYEEIKPLEAMVDKADKAAAEKGEVPTRELRNQIYRVRLAFEKRRMLYADANATDVQEVLMKTLNAGQIKAMANSLDVTEYEPKAKPEEMSQDAKIHIYVREILLDPMAYDLLVKLSL